MRKTPGPSKQRFPSASRSFIYTGTRRLARRYKAAGHARWARRGRDGIENYFWWTVAPGTHNIVSKGENNATLAVNAQPGQRYYVWQEVKMGMWQPRSNLHLVDEATGREAVKSAS